MATPSIVVVITRAWPGAIATASASGDDAADWSSIVWRDGAERPATLADAQAKRDEVAAEIAADAVAAEQQNTLLYTKPDAVLQLVEGYARQLRLLKAALPADVVVDWSTLDGIDAILTSIRPQS